MTQRLSALDAAFLNFESGHEPMHVAELFIFEGEPEIPGRPGVPGLFQTIEERLHLVPRYRQRVQEVPLALGHPVWVDDPDFDLAYHLRRLALPKPGGTRELLDVIARLHSRNLDRSRPLWEMYIIEGLQHGRVAIYAKTHHAMIDGISSVDLATTLLDFSPEGTRVRGGEPFRPRRLLSQRELVGDVVQEAAGAVVGAARSLLKRPSGAPGAVAARMMKATQLRELANVLRPVPSGPLNVKVGGARRVELVKIPLDRVKAIKNSLGGTVNDVILTAVGEGINAFLNFRGEAVADQQTYRIMVPVSVRAESDKSEMGNRVAAMFLDMPVGRMPARRRLQRVSHDMNGLKEHQQAVAADQLVGMTSWAPAMLHSLAGRGSYANQRFVNMVVSNVPGVQVPVYAGGARLLEAYPLLPVVANLSVVVCATSYDGGVYFGVVGDYDKFHDLDVLSHGIERGIENLERAAGVRPPKRAVRIGDSTSPARQVPRHAGNGARAHAPAPTPPPAPSLTSRLNVREAAEAAAATARVARHKEAEPVLS